LLALHYEGAAPAEVVSSEAMQELRGEIAGRFAAWLAARYGGLHNQPAYPPVMVHHIPKALHQHREETGHKKTALVLLDGMALDQWQTAKAALQEQNPACHFREHAVFAWIPTLTGVSRQAAFSGKIPLFFPNTILATDRDGSQWSQFWADHGVPASAVTYLKFTGETDSLSIVEDQVRESQLSVVGVMDEKVDKIMHGMQLGTAGMHNQVRQWVQEGFVPKLLGVLFKEGFDVFLTADHGNVEATGCGRPGEGSTAEVRGQRVRIFPDATLRANVKANFPAAIEWPMIGLPANLVALLAPSRFAFVPESERIVGHGAASLEEVMVPFVQAELQKV
jgi:hypothetical protein